MSEKWGENKCDMLPKIEKATMSKLKRNGIKTKLCRLKRTGGSINYLTLNLTSLCILSSSRSFHGSNR